MAGGISVHAVDVARGRVAAGLRVTLSRVEPGGDRVPVAEGVIGANGALDHPITRAAPAGEYELILHIGDFHAATGADAPRFLDLVPFRFRVLHPAEHVHLPIKFTPFGFSLYRGA